MSKKKFFVEDKNRTSIQSQGLMFYFKFLDLKTEKDFSLKGVNDKYIRSLLERLKNMTGMSIGEFQSGRGLHSHPIDWCKTTRKDGFKNIHEQLWLGKEWQFSAKSDSRVHGFLIDEIFYIVWLDPNHKLYKGKR